MTRRTVNAQFQAEERLHLMVLELANKNDRTISRSFWVGWFDLGDVEPEETE
jgi:hypothetical protein